MANHVRKILGTILSIRGVDLITDCANAFDICTKKDAEPVAYCVPDG